MLAAYTEDTPLRRVVKPAQAEALAKNKGLHTVGDLLEFVPRGYLPPNQLTDLGELRDGEEVMVVAEVAQVSVVPMRQRRGFRCTAIVTDGRVELDLTFFSRHKYDFGLRPGIWGVFAGTVTRYGTRRQLTHPEMELLDESMSAERADYLRTHQVPVYSATGKVTSFVLRQTTSLVLDCVEEVREPLPRAVRERRGLLARGDALELIHRPRLQDDVRPGMRRLRYDEAFVLQTILGQRRRAAQALHTSARMPRADGLLAAFDARLPFELTAGQREVGDTIAAELAADRPMHRLLQGEVGSGKTVVALRAMLAVVDAGGQAALLAPTEVLAAQHHRSISALLGDLAMGGMLGGSDLGTKVALLTGSQSTPTRRSALNDAVTGDAGIVVGTHALIQKHVTFFDLALVVVDEQHRFGVEQRDALREKGKTPPHLLVMTATPIPRTVAMTVFGDMETATLTELPAGRQPITTHVVDEAKPGWVERTWARVAEEVGRGHQAYVVCPKIGDPTDGTTLTADTSDEDDGWDGAGDEAGEGGIPTGPQPRPLAGVYAVHDRLRSEPALAGLRTAVLHGRLDADAKDRVMTAFARGEIDVLIATTVIEVGVDVPNATVMVVMDAQQFGISQLHQLRGRIGRGSAPGLCLLMTTAPTPTAAARLDAVAATTDGFELSRLDLASRREGDVLGSRQSGRGSSVRFLRMGNRDDEELIAAAREDAFAVLADDPDLAEHPILRARVAARLDDEQAAYLERG
ncbi:MAG TPA: ATP-dependent DNA helicase RecG [Dermatophilaceae bacterium]|jgi:ATP-dependent DNA helicase RecG|nr:ATP-dependent DNA helicase RecG [Dermatophilaceae bacterium]